MVHYKHFTSRGDPFGSFHALQANETVQHHPLAPPAGPPGARYGRIYYLVYVAEVRALADFVGAFFSSFQLGSLYALIALGYTMVYGIIRLINFAHGEIFMVGAFVSFFIFSGAPYSLPWALFTAALAAVGTMYVLNFWRGSMTDPFVLAGGGVALVGFTIALSAASLGWVWALILSMLITGVVGVLLDRIAYRPLRGAPRISLLITAIAMSFFLQNFGLLAFTQGQTPYRPDTFWTDFLRFEVAARPCLRVGWSCSCPYSPPFWS